MGTFLGHVVPALALLLLGLWHTVNTIRAYCLGGSNSFIVQYWYPFIGPVSKLKYLELIFILFFSVFAMLNQLFEFPYMKFALELDGVEHATMFLQLAVFSCFALAAHLTRSSHVLSGVTGILAASVFGQEMFLLHFHSADHAGIEGHYHWLLQLIVIVSVLAALASVGSPTNFPAALVLSLSVVFQGCWFLTMGLVLWVPELVPEGCTGQMSGAKSDYMLGAIVCGSTDADMRARALANLQFSWILSGILLLSGCVCLKYARSGQSTEYEKLHAKGCDVSITIDGFK